MKNLPTQTKSALQATEEFNEEADLLGALPVVKKLQALTTRAQSLMEDIHSEASELFTVLSRPWMFGKILTVFIEIS